MRLKSAAEDERAGRRFPPAMADAAFRVPRVVLAGETNSGKTTLANLLLQDQLLAVDIVPNTACPTLLRFGETPHLRAHQADGSAGIRPLADLHDIDGEKPRFLEIYLPSDVLRKIEILDLPGFLSHADAEAKSRLVRTADIQIWCTPATQAWKASEQAMWLSFTAPPKSSFLVLTHRELLSDKQFDDVAERMSRETMRFFSCWTAIAARNPSGRLIGQDVRPLAGVEDFMRKLGDLLQNVVTERRGMDQGIEVLPSRRPTADSAKSSLPHPLSSFVQFRQRILNALTREKTVEGSAAILAGALETYVTEVLKPWMTLKRFSTHEASRLEKLIPASEVEILQYLSPLSPDPSIRISERILDQIEAELTEMLEL